MTLEAPEVEASAEFETISRQTFRNVFQPSRIVLAVVPDAQPSGVNVITVCFHMHCSYQPPMMAFAIHRSKHSYALFQDADECVLSVPGEDMVNQTMAAARIPVVNRTRHKG